MADAEHQVTFEWPSTEPNTVVATGTFDQWSSSIHLSKTPTGFVGTTRIPWNEKIKYKFIVDGNWVVDHKQPTEIEGGSGFVNNVYTAPPKPADPPAVLPPDPVIKADDAEPAPKVNGHALVNGNGHAALNGVVVENAEKQGKEENKAADDGGEQKVLAGQSAGLPQLLSDFASTIVASHGTNSALEYVASGIGAAVHNVVGLDPINIQKISIPTPLPEAGFDHPAGDETAPNTPAPLTAPATTDAPSTEKLDSSPPSSPLAPRVPIMIVPVNAPENSTVPSTSPVAEVAAPPTVPEIVPPTENVVSEVAEPAVEDPAKDVAVEESTHGPVVLEAAPTVATSEKPAEEATPAPEPPKEEATTAAPVVDAIKTEEPAVAEVVPETKPEESTSAAAPEAAAAAGEALKEEAAPTPVPEAEVAAPVAAPEEAKSTVEAPVVPAEAPKAAEPTTAAAVEEKKAETPTETTKPATGASTPPKASPPAPVTPTKAHVFPTTESPSSSGVAGSPSPSRINSVRSSGKKRTSSIFGKLKDVFGGKHDKEKTKEKEKEKK